MNRFGSIWSVFLLGILVVCSSGIQGLSVSHCFGETKTTLNCSHSGLRKIHIDEVVHGFFYSGVSCLYFDTKSQSCEEEAKVLLIQTCDNRETCVLSSDIYLSCNFSGSAIKIEYQCGQQVKDLGVQVGVPLAVILVAAIAAIVVFFVIRYRKQKGLPICILGNRSTTADNKLYFKDDELVVTKPTTTNQSDTLNVYENDAIVGQDVSPLAASVVTMNRLDKTRNGTNTAQNVYENSVDDDQTHYMSPRLWSPLSDNCPGANEGATSTTNYENVSLYENNPVPARVKGPNVGRNDDSISPPKKLLARKRLDKAENDGGTKVDNDTGNGRGGLHESERLGRAYNFLSVSADIPDEVTFVDNVQYHSANDTMEQADRTDADHSSSRRGGGDARKGKSSRPGGHRSNAQGEREAAGTPSIYSSTKQTEPVCYDVAETVRLDTSVSAGSPYEDVHDINYKPRRGREQ